MGTNILFKANNEQNGPSPQISVTLQEILTDLEENMVSDI